MIRSWISSSLLACVLGSALLTLPATAISSSVFTVGQAKVIALQDYPAQMPTAIFSGADKDEIEKLAPGGYAVASINIFVIKLNGKHILVDAGMGAATRPGLSRAQEVITKAGIRPKEINAVLLTHLHFDHIGGIVFEGKRLFPNATIYVSRPEYAYWMSDEEMKKVTDPVFQANFELVRNHLALYKGSVRTFEAGSEVLPGIIARESFGHTPGHTSFLLTSDNERMLFWGDTVHAAQLQFPNPRISAAFDMDKVLAVTKRIGLMKFLASTKTPVAGAHLPYPGIGKVSERSPASFVYTPSL